MKIDKKFYGLVVLFFIILIVSPDYNSAFLDTGIYFSHGELTIEDIKNKAINENTLFLKEGLYGPVSVIEEIRMEDVNYEGITYEINVDVLYSVLGPLKTMKTNGKTQCSTGRFDAVTTGLLGGLPVILGKKGNALNIGLGCGWTLGILEKGDFESIDSIEIDPIVVDAAKEFNDLHNNAMDDSRANIIIDDGRNYLLKTDKKYDAIVTQPSHPYSSGASTLYTKEVFLLMKEHLKEDGIVVQWVPKNELESCDKPGFAIFYKTFSEVFPYNYVFVSKMQIPEVKPEFTKDSAGKVEITLKEINSSNRAWISGAGIFVGSLKPIDIEKYFDEKVRENSLREYYLFSHEDVAGFSEDVEINTDNKPIIEFLTAKDLNLPKELDCEIKQGIEFKGGDKR